MPIGEFDRPPSWSLECERDWGDYKIHVGTSGGVTVVTSKMKPTLGKKWGNRSFLSMNLECTSFWVNCLFSSTFVLFLKHFEPIWFLSSILV